MTTNWAGAIDGSFSSLPFGDTFAVTGTDYDQYHFAQLDYDTESMTDHAQFRQYSPTQGRWMSPDPYDGSYDFTNPQSFNRYTYAGNKPLSLTDQQGLNDDPGDPWWCDTDLWGGCFDGPFGPYPGRGGGGGGGGGDGGEPGSAPSSTTPSTIKHPIWDEHGGFNGAPYSSLAAMLGDVGGWYPSGCEFGVCGSGPSSFSSGIPCSVYCKVGQVNREIDGFNKKLEDAFFTAAFYVVSKYITTTSTGNTTRTPEGDRCYVVRQQAIAQCSVYVGQGPGPLRKCMRPIMEAAGCDF